jgi:hypothetical protein
MRIPQAFNAGSAVSIGAVNVAAVAANGNRSTLILQNDHATQVIYCSLGGTAVANVGLRLSAAGGTVVLDGYTGAVSAIATGASTPLLVTEI